MEKKFRDGETVRVSNNIYNGSPFYTVLGLDDDMSEHYKKNVYRCESGLSQRHVFIRESNLRHTERDIRGDL